MNPRKKLILDTIIKEYISTGNPVSSGFLVEKYDLGVSPATVRNDMSFLESEGYITQPHTSAGRVPTECGYKIYLEEVKEKRLNSKDIKLLDEELKKMDEISCKKTAKEIARISGQAVFWAFHKNNLYYTGISNLLSQPEFRQEDIRYDISLVIDHMDETIEGIFEGIKLDENLVMIGSENPFGDMCGTVMFKYKKEGQVGLFGILGPVRMDYEYCLSISNYIKKELKK